MTGILVWPGDSGNDVILATKGRIGPRIPMTLDEVRQLVDDLIPLLSPNVQPTPHTAQCFEDLVERVARLEESARIDEQVLARIYVDIEALKAGRS